MKDGDDPGQGAAALSAAGLTKSFSGIPALDDFALTVDQGTVHALLGENGSGKSTFIKILSGFHQPDGEGEAYISGKRLQFGSPEASYRTGCRFVHQDLGLVDSSSVLDNLSYNVGFPTRMGTILTRRASRRCRVSLERVGLDLDPLQKVVDLAPAEKTGVAVARALCHDGTFPARLLVLDEPTATLPDNEVRRLLDMIRAVSALGVGVVYVTHRLDEVFDIARDVTILRDGRAVITRRVEGLDHTAVVRFLVGRELEEIKAASESLPSGRIEATVKIHDLGAGRLRSLSFDARPGEITGVAGITGSGREVVLPAIFGATPRTCGSVHLDDELVPSGRPDKAIRAGIAYLPPDRKLQGGIMEMKVRENLTLSNLRPFWHRGLLRRSREIAESKRWIDKLDVRPVTSSERTLSTLSGGNQQKVLFAKGLRCSPVLWLLDEPTQGVDIGAKAVLHRQIIDSAKAGMVVIVSSSDADELVALCHRVLVLRDGQLAVELTGSKMTVDEIGYHSLVTQGGSAA